MRITLDSICMVNTAWLLELSRFIEVDATLLLIQPDVKTCSKKIYIICKYTSDYNLLIIWIKIQCMFVWFLLQCLLSVIPFYRDRAGTTLVSYINLWDKIRQKNNASFFRPNAAATSVTLKLYCQSKKWYTFSILIKIWILSYSICLSCNKNFKVSQADKLKIFLCLTCMLPVIQYLSKASDLKLIIKRNEESWLGLADLVSPQRWGDRDFSESVHKDPLLHVLPQVESHRGGFHQVIDLLIVNLKEGTLQEELWTLEYMKEGNNVIMQCFQNVLQITVNQLLFSMTLFQQLKYQWYSFSQQRYFATDAFFIQWRKCLSIKTIKGWYVLN